MLSLLINPAVIVNLFLHECCVVVLSSLQQHHSLLSQQTLIITNIKMATKYTLSEVAKHKSKDDLWFVIHGKVYDVTKFGDDHPGGFQALVDEAGTL